MTGLVLAAWLAAVPLPQAGGQIAETVSEVRVHGNHISTDDEVVKLAGVVLGSPFTASTIADASANLRASGKFDDVQVLKRFGSIADPSKIVVVIIVNEGPVRIEMPVAGSGPPKIVRRGGWRSLMFMPMLDAEDGYGVTYGVRVARVGPSGAKSRLSFPLTWGGLEQAGAEYERRFNSGPLSRVEAGAAIQRQTNPAFLQHDDRRRVWARAERWFGPVRAGGGAGWQHVSFAGLRDTIRSVGADVTIDTRLDPWLPHRAVVATAGVDRLSLRSQGPVTRTTLAAEGYLAVFGQAILVTRLSREAANQPLPPYLRYLLGGWSSLRGFQAGSFTGDTLVTGSVEVRVPLTSPLDVGKLGISVFMDAGKVYEHGQRFKDVAWRKGIGASVWMSAAVFRLSVSVAHGLGAAIRVNFGAELTF